MFSHLFHLLFWFETAFDLLLFFHLTHTRAPFSFVVIVFRFPHFLCYLIGKILSFGCCCFEFPLMKLRCLHTHTHWPYLCNSFVWLFTYFTCALTLALLMWFFFIWNLAAFSFDAATHLMIVNKIHFVWFTVLLSWFTPNFNCRLNSINYLNEKMTISLWSVEIEFQIVNFRQNRIKYWFFSIYSFRLYLILSRKVQIESERETTS